MTGPQQTLELPNGPAGQSFGPALGSAFRCIVADPPWNVKAGPAGPGYILNDDGVQSWDNVSRPSRDLPYQSLSVEEISALPVERMADSAAHLYLWTINRYVEDAYNVARAWGFAPSTLLVWGKTPMGGGLGGAYGISTEFILFCRRGTLPAKGRITGTWFNWKRPYNDAGKPLHSAKPEAFQTMVESVSPGPYLELFARRKRHGWASWGNEIASDVEMPNVQVSHRSQRPMALDLSLGQPAGSGWLHRRVRCGLPS